MRRGDLAIGAIIGLVVVGVAGIFFFRSGGAKSDLVALEKFDPPKKSVANSDTTPPAEVSKTLSSSVKPKPVTIPPVTPAPQRSNPERPDPSATPSRPLDSAARPKQPEALPVRDEPKTTPPGAPPARSSPDAPIQPIVPPLDERRADPAPSRPPTQANIPPARTHVPPVNPVTPPMSGVPQRLPLTHTVDGEETLSGIAQRYYNDPTLTALIMKANPELKDPNRIFPGMKLLIPDRTRPTTRPAVVRSSNANAASPGPRATPAPGTVPAAYHVQAKDTLISISKRFYGDSRRWKEIHELNRSVIGPDPEALKVGTVLKLPPARPAATQPRR